MTNEMKNVPELRFPEFEGEWKEKKFGEFTKTNQGLQIAISDRKTEFTPGLYFYITNEFLKPNSKTRYYIANPPESVIAKKSDVLMTRTGNTGKVITGVKGAFHNNFFKIQFDQSQYNRLFLFEVLKSPKIKNKILSLAGTSTIPDLNHSDFYSITSCYPTINEQQKIGDFFSKLDRQIELEEQKLEKLEEQKKGYMQKIFSQELRFKDENENGYPDWIFEELNNIFTKYQNTIYLHDDEEYKRISISNKGKITHRDTTFGKMIGRKRQYLIDLKKHPNTLTFIRQGVFLGGIGFIPSSLDGYIVTENMPLLSMSEEYSKKFMTSLFSSESYYKSVIFKNLPTGSAQKALHEKDWLKSFVNITVYSEQEKIGVFFEK